MVPAPGRPRFTVGTALAYRFGVKFDDNLSLHITPYPTQNGDVPMPEIHTLSIGTGSRGGQEILCLVGLTAAALLALGPFPWGTGILLALVIFSWAKLGAQLIRFRRYQR